MSAPNTEPVAQAGSTETSITKAEPYRTPNQVADVAKPRGMLRSPIAWVGLLLAAALVFFAVQLLRPLNKKGLIDHVVDFGEYSRSPPPELEIRAEP